LISLSDCETFIVTSNNTYPVFFQSDHSIYVAGLIQKSFLNLENAFKYIEDYERV
jgi:hypothetical protein